MVEKKEGKENEKCSTMPDVLIKGDKILRTVSVDPPIPQPLVLTQLTYPLRKRREEESDGKAMQE